MNYWHQVLAEVLNKHNPHYPSMLTNVRESLGLQYKSSQAVSHSCHDKEVIKKHTQRTVKVKKYRLGKKFPDVYFTTREAQVIYSFICGRSTIQTAGLLRLSRRTVEFYVNNMKIKLNCRFKSDLINTVIQSDFLQLADTDLKMFSKR